MLCYIQNNKEIGNSQPRNSLPIYSQLVNNKI